MKDSEGAKVVAVDTEGSTELPHQVAVHHCFHFLYFVYFHIFKTSPGGKSLFMKTAFSNK